MLTFDNEYYRKLLQVTQWEYDGAQFNSVTGDGTMMLEADFRLATDPSFSTWTRLFASDQVMFFDRFSAAFQKLGELGHDPAMLIAASYSLRVTTSGAVCRSRYGRCLLPSRPDRRLTECPCTLVGCSNRPARCSRSKRSPTHSSSGREE